MPAVTTPSIGNGFYVPGSAGFYQGHHKIPAQASESARTEEAGQKKSADSSIGNNSSLSLASQYADATHLSNILTASDLTSLDNMGMLGSFSGLLGSAKTNSFNNTADTVLLEKILSELNELKTNLNAIKNNGSVQNSSPAKNTEDAQKKEPSILRFNVNGYNLLSTCRTIYFSKPESDGSFLLTGDRKYTTSGKQYSETFHLLFKANGTNSGSITYNVIPALSQPSENKASSLYKICNSKFLTASRTGNLVSMRSTVDGTSIDLLLGIE